MRITCTGHAGLFIETAAGSVLCDPWRTPAYFASWFVFPDNSDVDFAALSPDYLYISHMHRDHFDPELLRSLVSKRATVILPDFPLDDLKRALRSLGFRSFVQTRNGEPTDIDGLRVLVPTVSSPADGPLGDSALALDDGCFRLLNQNDSRPRDLQPLLDFGPYDAHFLQFSGAIWWPVVYDIPQAEKHEAGLRKRESGMARAARFAEIFDARFVFPHAGPPAFLDDDLFAYNDLENSPDNPFPDQTVFMDYLAAHGRPNTRLLIPGSSAELCRDSSHPSSPVQCKVTHPLPDGAVARIFEDKKQYLTSYAERQRIQIGELRSSLPTFGGDLVAALAEWFDPILGLADHISEGIGGPVLLDLGDEAIVVDFVGRQVRRHSGEACRYRFTIERRLVEALVAEHQVDWVNSLFLSLRFSAWRKGRYNEFIYAFFKCLSEERVSYADGWYAEQETEELVLIGDYMVQRRCPHLKADLTRFGEVTDGILRCQMHGWRFDLATGRCLNSKSHNLLSFPVSTEMPTDGEQGSRG